MRDALWLRAFGNDVFQALAKTPFDLLCHHGAEVAITADPISIPYQAAAANLHRLPVQYSDVRLCPKAVRTRLKILYTPEITNRRAAALITSIRKNAPAMPPSAPRWSGLGAAMPGGPERQPRLAYGDASFSAAVGPFTIAALGAYRAVRRREPVAAASPSASIWPLLTRTATVGSHPCGVDGFVTWAGKIFRSHQLRINTDSCDTTGSARSESEAWDAFVGRGLASATP